MEEEKPRQKVPDKPLDFQKHKRLVEEGVQKSLNDFKEEE